MKKILTYLLIAMMFVSSFAACGKKTADSEETNHLKKAADYIYAMYKDKGTTTAMDFERTAQVIIGTTKYAVEWTTDNDAVKVTTSGAMATIDVAERSENEVKYTLTATVKDAEGNTESVSFNYVVPKWEGFTRIVEEAYTLKSGEAMAGASTLEGTITKIDTAWSDSYKNITVIMQVGDLVDKPIMCYRLTATNKEDADLIAQVAGLAVGDYITVTGTIKNYNGIIEFDAGCTLDALVKGEGGTTTPAEPTEAPVAVDPTGMTAAQILDAAYALEVNAAFGAPCTLTGVISEVNTAWSDQYNNITVTIVVDGKEDKKIECFRLAGDGAAELAVGDTITVTGIIKNYNGKVEFDAKCALDTVVKAAGGEAPAPTEAPVAVDPTGMTAAQILDAAYALEVNAAFGAPCTLTGVISEVNTAWNDEYKNITVTIVVDGKEDKKIECFRLVGDGAAELAVGDTITVTGIIKNYNGKVEFDAKCTLDAVVKAAGGEAPAPTEAPVAVDPTGMTAEQILDAAYALEVNAAFVAPCTLTGVISEVNTAWSDEYKNITVTIVVDGKEDKKIECFRLVGDGAAELAVGDTITVTGTIKNYKGKIEFDAKCNLDAVVKAEGGNTSGAADKAELNANDVAAGTIEAATTFGGFTIVGSADAAVTVDSNSKKSDSGLEFTQRIKLGGSGSIENRHVSFTTAGAAKITVYAMSSSSSADRPLLLMSADGVELGRGTALGKVEESTIPAMTFEVTEAGTYYLWSEESGINIYYISVE